MAEELVVQHSPLYKPLRRESPIYQGSDSDQDNSPCSTDSSPRTPKKADSDSEAVCPNAPKKVIKKRGYIGSIPSIKLF
ncbi:hypothetical protein QKU48_gp0148 [Fadolivirus algeromassiliense]|jgi:hypothetical protein|uniref:Uncharacterized protein n=1 Tax=Fadolivirus FV1/VV64 TaxID=3070911 RepID=A0A7D3QV29_9VIRU|nr:hypothetical protein QKU48_gp0148 [Fadolivirus algeromassiliense]QKF93606.1 hypothetical protein Fadolivirus_1_148 [Fadolivirus FV1/VV64]